MLVAGTLNKIRSDSYQEVISLQLTKLESAGPRYRCMASDGSDTVKAVLASQLSELVANGGLKSGAIVRLPASGYSRNMVDGVLSLIISELDVVQQGTEGDLQRVTPQKADPATAPSPLASRADDSCLDTPDAKKVKLESGPADSSRVFKDVVNSGAAAGASTQPRSRFATGVTTPGPAPSPSAEVRMSGFKPQPKTPGSGLPLKSPLMSQQPPSQQNTPALAGRRTFHPIASLHPYNDQWVIRAKLVRKYNLRTINGRSGESKLLTVELVDDSGVAIQGTFWRQQAEVQNEAMQEGKIYIISRFEVKPANKAYSSVKNDYEIAFLDRTEVVEAADQDGSAMQAQVDIVSIDNLPRYINRKCVVDVLGVVLVVGALGNVKRKSDNSELSRRDVTLGDKSQRSVVITLWGDHALNAQLDSITDAATVMQITNLRVSDYNGCSASSLSKSHMSLNPAENPATQDLLEWYTTCGRLATFTPLSESAKPGGSGGGESAQLTTVKQLPATMGVEEKAEYHTMFINVALVKEDQSLYYMANPENGKKVVERDGQYWCEADGKYVQLHEWRYVLSFRAIDSTGTAWLNLFNREGETLLGVRAEELNNFKEKEPEHFSRVLKDASWREWCVTTSSRAREYNSDVKVRHTITNLRPIDYVADGMKLVNMINAFQ